MLLVFLMPALCSCADKASAPEQDMPAAERVLRAMIEYPGAGLYTDSSKDADDAVAAQEKTAWQEAVGGCFADGMFDQFYDSYGRTSFLSEARNLRLTTKVTDIQPDSERGDDALRVTVEATDETGHVDIYETEWRVRYKSEADDLLESAELLADGGFFCRSGCPL